MSNIPKHLYAVPGFCTVYSVSEGKVYFQNYISYSEKDTELKYFSYLQGAQVSSSL